MYGYGFYGFDPTYVLVLIGVVLSLVASANVKTTFNRYSRTRNVRGLTGADVARRILETNGVYDVQVRHVSGELTDHFDPSSRTVNLSDSVYNSTSIAALGVAAHECGHVMQHENGYTPIKIRTMLVPAANFGSGLGFYIFFFGMVLSLSPLISIGIILFSLAVLFQIVTLPVEFNASSRALVMLEEYNLLDPGEVSSARKVLKAAALTYVASAAASILQLLRLIILKNQRDDD
ncbi:zinc metallopeptidase [Butyrivibrio sp. NC3005]|uniref:zinc metallopeptidase n=1 Tax=Butyrivibrio sp. NC3005 TaxID=1280685 RepID=UPI0003F9E4EA|nr:zinc metallopeptidase [Butyrivibrio sp. NC3005]